MTIHSVNPTTGDALETFQETSDAELEAILGKARAAFLGWRKTAFAERAAKMRAAGRILREERALLARTMTLEMGKPITEAEGEIEKCAGVCDYYAEHAEAFLSPEPRQTDATAPPLATPSDRLADRSSAPTACLFRLGGCR